MKDISGDLCLQLGLNLKPRNDSIINKMKIGWMLTSSRNNAGSRMHGWNIHDYFLAKGIDSEIIYFSPKYDTKLEFSKKEIDKIILEKYDILVLVGFKSDETIIRLVKLTKKAGVKIVYIKTDEISLDLVEASDATIMVTEFAKSELPLNLQQKINVVFDGYEQDGSVYKKHTNKKCIKLVFISNNVYSALPQIKSLPQRVSLKIIGPPKERVKKYNIRKKVFSETPYLFEYKVWGLDTVEKDILDCDVAIIPYPDKHLRAEYINRKSSNRLILFMSYALPTIVSPTKEYENLIEQGKNGFIAKSEDDWQKFIRQLRDNPKIRRKIGIAGRNTVVGKYSKELQAEEYLKVFKKVIS